MLCLLLSAAVFLLAGCGKKDKDDSFISLGISFGSDEDSYTRSLPSEAADAPVHTARGDTDLSGPVTVPELLLPEATGETAEMTDDAIIDYSNIDDGYVMTQYTKDTSKKLKVQVKGPFRTYTFNLSPRQWETFPLADGNGLYQVAVYENVQDSMYSTVLSVEFDAAMTDEFAPFLRPNQYVNYAEAPETIELAARLTKGLTDPLDKVAEVYDCVTGALTYDTELAKNVKSGYLPDIDEVMRRKQGICFDYAAVMTGMLRSQDVPCKLVVGYAGEVYHAWISVWSDEYGWIEAAIYFDGETWQRMDPTFASAGENAESIREYIGDSSNYHEMYYY